jgi:signal transduction histidine kinase
VGPDDRLLFLTGNIVWLLDRRFAVEEEVIVRTKELRRARDEARAANQAKSDFLATMSHENRTPLNGVISMVDHLLEKRFPADVREPLEIIAKSGGHLLSVINNILDYSKLEARKLTLEEPVRHGRRHSRRQRGVERSRRGQRLAA